MTDVQPGDRFCRRCGAALSVLASCPNGCVDEDEPITPNLRLVEDEDESFESDEPDEEGRGW